VKCQKWNPLLRNDFWLNPKESMFLWDLLPKRKNQSTNHLSLSFQQLALKSLPSLIFFKNLKIHPATLSTSTQNHSFLQNPISTMSLPQRLWLRRKHQPPNLQKRKAWKMTQTIHTKWTSKMSKKSFGSLSELLLERSLFINCYLSVSNIDISGVLKIGYVSLIDSFSQGLNTLICQMWVSHPLC